MPDVPATGELPAGQGGGPEKVAEFYMTCSGYTNENICQVPGSVGSNR
jgi:hypothetical protein